MTHVKAEMPIGLHSAPVDRSHDQYRQAGGDNPA